MSQTPKSHFIHRLDYNVRERIVGIFVLIGTALLIGQIVISGQAVKFFEPKRTYIIELRNPVGVSADTKVRVSGLEVGWVDNVFLTEANTFRIQLAVYEKFHALIRSDSRASVSKLAVVGDSVINISPGSIARPALDDGDALIADEGLSVDDIMSRLQPVLDQAEESAQHFADFLEALPTAAMPRIVDDLQATMTNLRKASDEIVNGKGLINDLVYGQQLQNQLDATLTEVQATLTMSQLAMDKISLVLEKLPEFVDDSHGLVLQADTQLKQLQPLVDEANFLVTDSQQILDTVSNTWPLSKVQTKAETQRSLDVIPVN